MSVDAWLRAVVPRAPGISLPHATDEIVRVMDDFCTRSTVWRNMTRGVDLPANAREVEIPQDDPQAEHVGVLRAYLQGRRLLEFSHSPYEYSSDQPSGFSVVVGPPLVLVFTTIPTIAIAGELDVWTYDKPADPVGAGVPSVLTGEFFDPIFHGVMAGLMGEDSKTYSNSALATYHASKYQAGISRARARAASGFTSNAQGWTFPRFGA